MDIKNKLLPAYEKNNIAICMASSNEYAIFVSVVIQSILDNSSEENNYDIVILNSNISLKNKKILSEIVAAHKNFSIRFYDVNEYVKNLQFYTWAHFTKFTYYRLLIPSIFCEYDKVIYLDCDIIVNRDIAILYNTDINNFLLAAVRDTHVVSRLNMEKAPDNSLDYFLNTLKLKHKDQYFQCGVLVLNIKLLNIEFEDGYLLKQSVENNYKWLDQDLLNVECEDKVKFLPNEWNVMIFNTPENIDEKFLPQKFKTEYFNARKSPYIIHYIGKSIPCYKPNVDMGEQYWKYAKKSAYYEKMLAIMMDYKIAIATKNLYLNKNFVKKIRTKRDNTLIWRFINFILPYESKRREFVRNLYRKFKKVKREKI